MKKLRLSPDLERTIALMSLTRRWGHINVYTCEKCGTELVTTDLDEGTTPFTTLCRAAGCSGFAVSGMYRVSPHFKKNPTHAWYRPDTIDGLPDSTVEHLTKGGLILRELTAEELSVFEEGGR